MNPNIHTNFQRNMWKSFAVIAYGNIFEESKWGNVQSESVAMATIFVRFAENCKEVMVDLYEGIVRVW